MAPPASSRRSGFTFVELLVVLLILALLLALLFPAMSRMRVATEKSTCVNHLRKLGAASHLWASEHNGILPPAARADDENKLGTLEELLEPYVGPWVDRARLIAADGFYCPSNVRLGSPPPEGYETGADGRGRYKGWSGYMIGYTINGSIHPIHRVDNPERPVVRLSQVQHPARTLSLADINTRDAKGPVPAKALNSRHFFDPARLQPSWFGAVHGGHCNVLFVDGHVAAYPLHRPLPVFSMPEQEAPWFP